MVKDSVRSDCQWQIAFYMKTNHDATWTGLRKKALRNLWSGALSSENFQLTTDAHLSLPLNNNQKLKVAFFAVAERNKF